MSSNSFKIIAKITSWWEIRQDLIEEKVPGMYFEDCTGSNQENRYPAKYFYLRGFNLGKQLLKH
jgi:hypothetical protein